MSNEQVKELSTNLTISDLKVINTLIELIASRGLIKPNDYKLIGSIYEKISAILKSDSETPSN